MFTINRIKTLVFAILLVVMPVGQTIWGAVKFLDGDRYIAVTKSVNTYGYNDPKGGWGCIVC